MFEWGDCSKWGRVFCKNCLVNNLFTAWALTENIFTNIPRHEYIFIFKSFACFLQQSFIDFKKERTRGYPPESVLLIY